MSQAVPWATALVGLLIWMSSPRNLRRPQAKKNRAKSTPNWKKSSQRSRLGMAHIIHEEFALTVSDATYYAKVFEKVKVDRHYPMNEKHRLEAIVANGNVASEK